MRKIWLTTAQGEIPLKGDPREEPTELTSSRPQQRSVTATPAYTATITRPYFYRDSIETAVYQLKRPELRNAPQTPPALTAWATLTYRSAEVTLGSIVRDGAQPVRIVPAANISLSHHAQVLPRTQKSFELVVHGATLPATSNTKESYRIKIQAPPDWSVANPGPIPARDYFRIAPPATWNAPITLRAEAVSTSSSKTVSEGYRPIGYGDLPRTNYFTPATDRIVPVDLKLPTRTRIAYLPGTGDSIPDALTSIGLKPTILTIADLTAANLAQYDTVILGVRTYNAHPNLHGAPTQALFDYARNGGNVIVQFQTGEFSSDDAPYPVTLGRAELVSDETAAVQLIEPTSPLLTTPNKISSADFNNWVEERGHGFLRTWDPHYTALTETHDPGQLPQRGGLITTQLGKGRWTYCAFALYRQLPEAIPGAYRLFANLLNP